MPNLADRQRRASDEREGRLGSLMTSFWTNDGLGREVISVKVREQKAAVRIRKNPGYYSFGLLRHDGHRKPIKRILLSSSTVDLNVIVGEVESCFKGSRRILLAVCLELKGTRKTWTNQELLNSFEGFLKYKNMLETEQNNGNRGAVHFWQKMVRMEDFEIASNLGLNPGSVEKTFEAIKTELTNFD